jgi:hypothetical protein
MAQAAAEFGGEAAVEVLGMAARVLGVTGSKIRLWTRLGFTSVDGLKAQKQSIRPKEEDKLGRGVL